MQAQLYDTVFLWTRELFVRDRSLFSGGGGGGGEGHYFLNSNLGRATFFKFEFRGGL